jgi:nucleoside-diphosphate kinase
MKQMTFAMIKPDGIKAKITGKIIDMIEQNGFDIVRMEKVQLDINDAQAFYDVHSARPFFAELTEFVSSDPVIIMALEKDNAINAWRDLMGATDSKKAAAGTVREKFGSKTNIMLNVTHGSDSVETAEEELMFFFPDMFIDEEWGIDEEDEDKDFNDEEEE